VEDLAGNDEFVKTINRHNYLSVAFRNHPMIEKGNIIYVKSLGNERNRQLVDIYRERKVFLFEYTGGITSFRLIPYTPDHAPLKR
jgi:hypothetical protein